MSFDTYLVIDDGAVVKGETGDKAFKDKGGIEIFSFSWGESNSVTLGGGSKGGGAGKVSLSSFNIMKKYDSASPFLMNACATGTHFAKAQLTMRKSGGTQIIYTTIDFTIVYVESVQISGSSGGDDTPTESVSFAFEQIDLQYSSQNSEGTAVKGGKFSWNVASHDKDA